MNKNNIKLFLVNNSYYFLIIDFKNFELDKLLKKVLDKTSKKYNSNYTTVQLVSFNLFEATIAIIKNNFMVINE